MNAKTLTIASAFVAFMMVAGPAGAQNATPDAAAPAATAPADAAAGAPPPANINTPTTAVKNPYGLGALVQNGDLVSHTVLGLLLVMSLGTWYIFVTKYVE
jgi:biopolymer transport protein ExbB